MNRPDTINNGPTRRLYNAAILSFDRRRRPLDAMIAEAQAMAESNDEYAAAQGRDFLNLDTSRARIRQMADEQEGL